MQLLPLALLHLTAQAINILSSNDDGWAEINIRTLYDALTTAGHSVVISAPAENESGTDSDDAPPTTLTEECEYHSCPSGSPAYGSNSSQPRFNYVNSYPVTSVKYGLAHIITPYFSTPDLVVSGPNVGPNTGSTVRISGTAGAASYAASVGLPALAFSGTTGSQTAWTVSPVPSYSNIYADLARTLSQAIISSGTPYLPDDIWLNVNFPAVGSSSCTSADDFDFVLSRITSSSGHDVDTCGSTSLPTESTVVGTSSGCYVSVSVANSDKSDSNSTIQAVVLDKLSSLLTCLP